MSLPSTVGWYIPPAKALLAQARQRAFVAPKLDEGKGTTLLISGAGYSKPWGLPVTSEIPQEVKRLTAQNPFVQEQMLKPVRDLIAYVEAKQGEKFDFEDFTTWIVDTGMADDMSWWDKLGFPKEDRPMEDAEFFYRMLNTAFAWVLMAKDPMSEMLGPPPSWEIPAAYAQLEAQFGRLSGIVTLNYDVLPEHLYADRGIDYGLSKRRLLLADSFRPLSVDTSEMLQKHAAAMGKDGVDLPPEFIEAMSEQYAHKVYADQRFKPGPFPVLKIHGGMNLGYCPECDRILVFPPWLRRTDQAQFLYPGYDFGWARSGGHQAAFHCKDPTGGLPPNMESHRLQPVSIPPVKNKERLPEWPLVEAIQERAVELAGQAEAVLVVGTTVRPADQALYQTLSAVNTPKVFYIGGTEGFNRLKQLCPSATRVAERL